MLELISLHRIPKTKLQNLKNLLIFWLKCAFSGFLLIFVRKTIRNIKTTALHLRTADAMGLKFGI